MTEDEARARVLADVPRETASRLDTFCSILVEEAARQNLIAASTVETLWTRHILDSAQLIALAPKSGMWIDIGSGAGLPGLVVSALTEYDVHLVEPRAKRCIFLRDAAEAMGVADRVTVVQSRIETAPALAADVISARAVAALPQLFAMAKHFATPKTHWILPKGRSAADEVAEARKLWHASIKLVPSLTDSEAAIVVATDVRPRKRP